MDVMPGTWCWGGGYDLNSVSLELSFPTEFWGQLKAPDRA